MGFFVDDEGGNEPLSLDLHGRDIGPDVAGFTETFGAAFDAFQLGGRGDVGDALHDEQAKAWSAVVEYAPDDPLKLQAERSLTATLAAMRGMGQQRDVYDRALRQVEPIITRAKAEGPQESIRTADEAYLEAQRRVREAEDRAARGDGLGAFASLLAAGFLQPTSILTMPLNAARSAPVLAKVAYQMGINAAQEATVQAGKTSQYRQHLGLDWSPGEAALDIGMAALTGGAFEGLGLAVARALRPVRDAYARGQLRKSYGEIGEFFARYPDALDALETAIDAVEQNAALQARNPLWSVRGSATRHLEALDAAQRGVADGVPAPGMIDTLQARVAELEDLDAGASSRLADAEAAEAAQGRGSVLQWAQSVARRGLAWSLGVDPSQVGIARLRGADGASDVVRLTLPDGRTLDLPETGVEGGGVVEARRAVDALTDELGVDRVPMTRRERAAADLGSIRAEREGTAKALEAARTQASRVVGDALGQPGGRSFRKRKDAADWARRNNLGDFSVVRRGRGFVVRQDAPPARAPGERPLLSPDQIRLTPQGRDRIRQALAAGLPNVAEPGAFADDLIEALSRAVELAAARERMTADDFMRRLRIRQSVPDDVPDGALLQAEELLSEVMDEGRRAERVAEVRASGKPVKKGAVDPEGEEKESDAVTAVAQWLTKYDKDRAVVPADVQAALSASARRGGAPVDAAARTQAVDGIAEHTVAELKAWRTIRSALGYLGFYDVDIELRLNPELVNWAKLNHGVELKPEEIQLYHLLSAFASPARPPLDDSNHGLQIFDRFLRTRAAGNAEFDATGRFRAFVWKQDKPGGQRMKTATPEYEANGRRKRPKISTAYEAAGLKRLQRLYESTGGNLEETMAFLTSPRTAAELEVAYGAKLRTHEYLSDETGGYGIFALTGPKLGSYFLNRVGIYTTSTKDLWFARTAARQLGLPLVQGGKVIKDPFDAKTLEGKLWREIYDDAWRKAARELDADPEFRKMVTSGIDGRPQPGWEGRHVEIAMVQQWMWDFEKFLWWRLGGDSADADSSASSGLRAGQAALRELGPLSSEGPAMDALRLRADEERLLDLELGAAAKQELFDAETARLRDARVAEAEARSTRASDAVGKRKDAVALLKKKGVDTTDAKAKLKKARATLKAREAELAEARAYSREWRMSPEDRDALDRAREMVEFRRELVDPRTARPTEGVSIASPSEVDGDNGFGMSERAVDLSLGNFKFTDDELPKTLSKEARAALKAEAPKWEKVWRERMEHGDLLAVTVEALSGGRAKVKTRVRGVGTWSDGQEPTFVHEWIFEPGMTAVEKLDWVRYHGDMTSRDLRQKGYMAVVPATADEIAAAPDGVPRGHLFTFTIPGKDRWAARQELAENGIVYSTLSEVDGGARVVLYDDKAADILAYLDRTGYDAQHDRVLGGFFGLDDREAAVRLHAENAAAFEGRVRGGGAGNREAPVVSRVDDARGLEPSADGRLIQHQRAGTVVRGALEWVANERAVMHLLQDANVTTPIHEFGHFLRKYLPDDLRRASEEWLGVKDGLWTVEHHEAFADGLVRFMSEGVAPAPDMAAAFSRIAGRVRELGDIAYGTKVELTPQARTMFEQLLGADPDARALDVVARAEADPLPGRAAQTASMAEAARVATRATGNPDMTAAEVDAWHRGRYNGQGKSAADALDENDEALLETLNDDDLAMEIGQSENGTIARDADGVATKRALSEILRDADEEIGALRAIRECIIGG